MATEELLQEKGRGWGGHTMYFLEAQDDFLARHLRFPLQLK